MSIREDVRTQRRVACSMYLGRRGGGVLCCTATFPPRRNLHLNQEDGGRGRTNSKTNEALASSSLSPLLPSLPPLPQSPCNKSTSFPSFIHRNMIFALAASLTDCTDERERERRDREREGDCLLSEGRIGERARKPLISILRRRHRAPRLFLAFPNRATDGRAECELAN